MRRRRLFDAPGKAVAWGLGACLICLAVAAPATVTIGATLVAALGGCFNG